MNTWAIAIALTIKSRPSYWPPLLVTMSGTHTIQSAGLPACVEVPSCAFQDPPHTGWQTGGMASDIRTSMAGYPKDVMLAKQTLAFHRLLEWKPMGHLATPGARP